MIDRPELLAEVVRLGGVLADGLAELPGVRLVRGRGLMQAIEVDDAPARDAAARCSSSA